MNMELITIELRLSLDEYGVSNFKAWKLYG